MATKELDILMQQKQENGDTNIMYPVTKIENVLNEEGNPVKIYDTRYVKNYELQQAEWIEEATKGGYHYTIQDSGVTENHRVNIYMDLVNQEKLTDGYTDTTDGFIHIYTSEKPSDNVTINLEIQPIKIGTISK